jgi:cyclopropane-fatty-acyl-phospholipid synthase
MIEAVDWRKYREFFGDLATLLKPDGRLAMQAITMNDQSFDRAKRQEDFIRDLIFPGGCLPSIEAILRTTRDVTDFTLVDVEDIGLHYAHTLDLWDQRVDENYQAIQALGFDERFRRLWRLYLRYCEAAFLERHISDVQLLFHRRATPQVLAARAV